MSTSQNSWPVVAKSACDQGPFRGIVFPNGILAGDVATVARWQMMRYEQLVEPMKPGSCWGWFVRVIRGQEGDADAEYSNHSSATAWDINADKYPLGAEPAKVMSAAKIAACRQIIREAGGVLRWGGMYTGRKDVMHWEINAGKSAVATFAALVRSGKAPGMEDNVDANDVKVLLTTDGLISNPSNAYDRSSNPTLKLGEAITNTYFHTLATEKAVLAMGPVLTQLATKDTVDEQALAQALAPLLAALLPTGVEVTPETIVEAFRQMAGAA